jgi:hypothetical protein
LPELKVTGENVPSTGGVLPPPERAVSPQPRGSTSQFPQILAAKVAKNHSVVKGQIERPASARPSGLLEIHPHEWVNPIRAAFP